MRITTVRILVQILAMALFLAFVFVTTMVCLDEMPALKFWVSKYLEIDPLIAIGTAISTHTLYKGLIWSLVLLVPTLFLGRFFCNWLCPFGDVHHFVGWVFNNRKAKARIESNRYGRSQQIKYYVLIAMLVAGVFGSLQIGLLDPICLLHRSLTTAVVPALNMPLAANEDLAVYFGDNRVHQFGWLIAFLIVFFVGMNLVLPRFFCRVLCPLGATLGILSRFSLWRIDRDKQKCTDCGLCLRSCEGACDPHDRLRKSECLVCFNCIEDCPEGALSFSFLPARGREVAGPDLPRRKAVFAAVAGVLFYPFARLSGKSTKNFSTKVLRPPGAVEELEFLERCIKCAQCMRVCPTNVLQPATLEAGLEGVWTPVMNFRIGHCQLNCTACGQVCPTGAIQKISVAEKLGLGEYADRGPVRLGTAHFDTGRCLPWSKNIPCVVCEEVCPTSPKAVYGQDEQLLIRDGKKQVLGASATTVTLADYPEPGQAFGQPCTFRPRELTGDQATRYYVQVIHRDGTTETHRIIGHDSDTLMIGQLDPASGEVVTGARFATLPMRGEIAAIALEYKVPKIDTELCIGCGLCELHCPVVGDRRAVYVTADGETRSQEYGEGSRNRSLRLNKRSDAG